MQDGWHNPLRHKIHKIQAETHEFFLEARQEPQKFTYDQYAELAQIRQKEPIIAFISKIFHTKLIEIRKIS